MTYFSKTTVRRASAGLLGAALLALLSACASGLIIGEVPAEPAPQIVSLGVKDAQSQAYLTWENPQSFGKVPADLQPTGDVGCMKLDINLRAVGYHPKARDRSGAQMPCGGYFCQLQILGGLSGQTPRVVLTKGVPGWDKPGAFGAVPASELARGTAICAQNNAKAKPLAYHPAPLDLNGRPMPGGGFLCVE